ncbi:MAG TPA: HlyD family efflux transporter periplasmic adaptor subunit [Lacipirellula sp.]
MASFVVACAMCVWLWQQRGAAVHGIGEVEALRIDVTSPTTGMVTALPHRSGGQWSLYDQVVKGDVIATFDDRQTQLDKDLLRQEVEQLFEQIAQWQIESTGDRQPGALEAIQRVSQYERSQLSALQQLAQGEAHASALPTPAADEPPMLPEGVAESSRVAFAKLRHARDSLELRWKEIHLQSELRVIRAPISGTLIAVYCWPGQTVHQGALVATIAADHGRHIVSYLPEQSTLEPTPGMKVTIRPRMAGAARLSSEIEKIGRQVRRVPDHQLGSAAIPQWGLPVRIKLPNNATLQPGALVDVVFHRPRRASGMENTP